MIHFDRSTQTFPADLSILAGSRPSAPFLIRRAEDDGARERRHAGIAGRQVVGRTVLSDRLDAARLGIGDGDEPQIDQPPVMREPDHVGRIEGQL